MERYQEGQIVYFIANNILVKRALILRKQGTRYVLSILDGGGVCLPETRLYHTQEEAEDMISRLHRPKQGYSNPYGQM